MHRTLLSVFACLGLCACRISGDGAKTDCVAVPMPEAASGAPADLTDLSHWYLTLPVDAYGNPSGSAHTVSTAELTSGYSSDWFYAGALDGESGVTFFAPVEGATTAHTRYPRSELREVLDPSDYSVNWTAADVANLAAELVVHQVPSDNGKVTLGEIVGYNGSDPDVNVLTKLVLEYDAVKCSAKLYTTTLPAPTASGSDARHQVLTRSLSLGKAFAYTIHVQDHQITFTSGQSQVIEPIDASWDGVGLYFRAGAALWSAGSSLTDGARVTFYQLQATH